MNINQPYRQIRAIFTEKTIRIYQAYSDYIADTALQAGAFVSPPYKMDRMTWIKPSFLWMMYRSGWGEKKGQERILAVDISREGFEWALRNSCLSHFESDIYSSREEWYNIKQKSPVLIQWDPERDIFFKRLDWRSIQIGLSGIAVEQYVNDWIIGINDITQMCYEIKSNLQINIDRARDMLPREKQYPLPDMIKKFIGSS